MNPLKKYLPVALILAMLTAGNLFFYFRWMNERRNALSYLVVDKERLRIYLYDKSGKPVKVFPVAVGTNKGDKQKPGDLRTPEGMFPVESVEDASDWKYDFENDSQGPVANAYGPWFIRLAVPRFSGIGIHGTHDSSTIGMRVSHGCIRMRNEDLEYLKPLVRVGMNVLVLADKSSASSGNVNPNVTPPVQKAPVSVTKIKSHGATASQHKSNKEGE